ncbi:MAG: hypothetical protein WB767_15595 [Nocardioides sp.]
MSRILFVGTTTQVVRELRDTGHEVVVVSDDAAAAVAAAAVQEDVDAVVVAHGGPEQRAALQAAGADDVPVHALDEGATVDSIVDHLH